VAYFILRLAKASFLFASILAICSKRFFSIKAMPAMASFSKY